ncbi:MAG: hypothetical protein JXQ90_21745 [Cyclobacteriaceae bacterium]
MNTAQSNYSYYLHSAKKLYLQENSFPSVYRYLVKDLDPDQAISIIEEIKKLNLDPEKLQSIYY